MTTLQKNTVKTTSGFINLWHRTPVLIKTLVMGFLVNIIGVFGVPVFSAILPLPLALIAIPLYLFLYWKFFSGSWGHQASKEVRKKYFRVKTLSPAQWRWSVLATVLFVILFQVGMVVTFRFIELPAERFTHVYGLDTLPAGIAWVAILFAALSAGLCEEVGFRGYGQIPLEERYGPMVAILIGSALFMVAHLHQAWAPPILLHIFGGGVLLGILAYTTGSLVPGIIAHTLTDIVNFSYWWSNVAGRFEQLTLSQTGIDTHFIISTLIFIVTTAFFFYAIRKINALRKRN